MRAQVSTSRSQQPAASRAAKSIGGGRFAAELHSSCQRKAADLVKTCAKMFALKNMDAWLAELQHASDALAGAAAGGDTLTRVLGARLETLAANCMLIAEATDPAALARAPTHFEAWL